MLSGFIIFSALAIVILIILFLLLMRFSLLSRFIIPLIIAIISISLFLILNAISFKIYPENPALAKIIAIIGIFFEGTSFILFYIYTVYIRRGYIDEKDLPILAYMFFVAGETTIGGEIIFVKINEGWVRYPVMVFNNILVSHAIYAVMLLIPGISFTYNAYILAREYRESRFRMITFLVIGFIFIFDSILYQASIFIGIHPAKLLNLIILVSLGGLIIILYTLIKSPQVLLSPIHKFFFISIYDKEGSELASFINPKYDVNLILETIEKVSNFIELFDEEGVIFISEFQILVSKGESFVIVLATSMITNHYLKFAKMIDKKLSEKINVVDDRGDSSLHIAQVLIAELKNLLIL